MMTVMVLAAKKIYGPGGEEWPHHHKSSHHHKSNHHKHHHKQHHHDKHNNEEPMNTMNNDNMYMLKSESFHQFVRLVLKQQLVQKNFMSTLSSLCKMSGQ